jgi:hypothetical protein
MGSLGLPRFWDAFSREPRGGAYEIVGLLTISAWKGFFSRLRSC